MNLPLNPPIPPMLAKRIDTVPDGDGWIFEPKWDGFRALIFRDGPELLIQSRESKPLNRYFPELEAALLAQLPPRCILDGEIVIAASGRLDFDALQLRVHPAASRIRLLARETPASIVFFDLLAEAGEDLSQHPFAERRQRLTALLHAKKPPIHLTPATTLRTVAEDWFSRFEGAGLDGVMAKPAAGLYQPDKRTMFKVKHERDCDCVVAGFRWYKENEGTAIGSLLLGLYNAANTLQHVGVCGSFPMTKRRELVSFLAPYREDAAATHPWSHHASHAPSQTSSQTSSQSGAPQSEPTGQRIPGAPSRWNSGKDLSWIPLRPELVVEVAYEHMQGDRFRHMAQFRRWRTDKSPTACTYTQLEVVPPEELTKVFSTP